MLRWIKYATAVLQAALLLFCCACNAKPQASPELAAATAALNSLRPSDAPAEYYPALTVARAIEEYEQGYIVYPRVSGGEKDELINDSIYTEAKKAASAFTETIFTEYTIKNNSNGIYSIILYIRGLLSGEQLSLLTLTYDCKTGKKLSIADCLDSEDDSWRRIIPEIIQVKAKSRNITLLNELLPIKDDRSFYISGSSVAIRYDLYEIATYSAGRPEFFIPISQLEEFITASSPLYRML